jgi:hypothetical protein
MPTFLQIGHQWINLEVIASAELIEDPGQPGKIVAVRVYYTSGRQQDFTGPSDVQGLVSFLRTHKAP